MISKVFVTLTLAALALAAPAAEDAFEKRAGPAQVITRCTVPNTAALTFDDGPYIYGKDVVDTLDKNGAKGTFFYNGMNYDCIYDQNPAATVKYAYDHGHQVASHTWAHKHLNSLTFDQVHDEMWRVEQALLRITGAYPAFMRPPYGEYNANVLKVAGQRNQSAVIWDLDSGDSTGSSVAQQKAQYDAVVSRHPSTVLSLEHEVYETTAHQTLQYAITKLKGAGYRLVTVAECVGKQPYQSVSAPQSRTSDWHC
ncbi:carbohydrate esterase family 4 protein [Macrolepiota fuliginosa MF-IS2]|uniref:Carbohydrate esterase family 4 protein n=1 Tax=Macrolepiota fuliginosa MF-IS2 TaxID=1400762 RepID=A0A9P5X1Z2_9AGAR|nr:carbohydrate esterase family 4 protein [Macrolepiota fuliginosa MF-IS2]